MDKEFLKSIILPVGILIIAYIIVDKILGISKAKEEAAANKERELLNQAEKGDEKAKLQSAGMKLSYPPSKYRDLANRLYTAMKGIGTDANQIMQVFSQLGNDLDFIALNEAFGVRDEEDLTQWIVGEGNSLSSKINKYLRGRKIKYSV